MRALVFAVGLALAAVSAHAETIIAAADAPKHVGETVTVEGTVSAVHTEPRSGVTFIDVGGRYPDRLLPVSSSEVTSANFGMWNRWPAKSSISPGRCMTIKEGPRPS